MTASGKREKFLWRFTLLRLRSHSESGLTLVETLIALAIMAAVVTAIAALVGQTAQQYSRTEEILLAGTLADNLLIEELARPDVPSETEDEGVVEFAGREWAFVRRVGASDRELVQISIDVRRADETRVLASATTLRGPP